ncbi:pentapeptide repeat-containing protein [Paraburkholderia sediminicola]|uniref:pentapeptide repeat-containing protein n=1 Tax=Paraburkholderia sediminicola TaxID=458836 RepID=UPI0038B98AF3
MPIGISAQSIFQELKFLVACKANLTGELWVDGKSYAIRQEGSGIAFVDVPQAPRPPEWSALFRQSNLRSSSARWIDENYVAAKTAIAEGAKATVSNEELLRALTCGASFGNAIFSEVNFEKIDVCKMSFEGARFERCAFKNTELNGTVLKNCTFCDCTFEDVGLSQSNAQGARFENCSFTLNTSFEKANLSNATFTNCDFRFVGFDASNLVKAQFTGGYMHTVFFQEADARDAVFERVNYTLPPGISRPKIPETRTSMSDAYRLNFLGTKVFNTLFADCDLAGTAFPYNTHGIQMQRCNVFGSVLIQLDFQKGVDQATSDSRFYWKNPIPAAAAAVRLQYPL